MNKKAPHMEGLFSSFRRAPYLSLAQVYRSGTPLWGAPFLKITYSDITHNMGRQPGFKAKGHIFLMQGSIGGFLVFDIPVIALKRLHDTMPAPVSFNTPRGRQCGG